MSVFGEVSIVDEAADRIQDFANEAERHAATARSFLNGNAPDAEPSAPDEIYIELSGDLPPEFNKDGEGSDFFDNGENAAEDTPTYLNVAPADDEEVDPNNPEPAGPSLEEISSVHATELANVVGTFVPATQAELEEDNDVEFDLPKGAETSRPDPKHPNPSWGNAPAAYSPSIDSAPTLSTPVKPSLLRQQAPAFGGITLPEFDITINPSFLPTLSNSFYYSEDPFSPQVLNTIIDEVREVLGGRLGVPAWVWNATWSRGTANINRQKAATVYEAESEYASKGWDMPGMFVFTREEAATQEANKAINDLTRENTVQQSQQQREDFWNAMQQGVACEQLVLQAFSQMRERILRAAVEYHNANISVYNAAVQAYQVTEIAAKDALIRLKDLELRGSLAELQVYESELKAVGISLEIDKTAMELYTAEWQGESVKFQTYATYVEGIKAAVQAKQAEVQAYETRVRAESLKIQAWVSEWDAYVKSFEDARIRIANHQAENSLFGNRVQFLMARTQEEKNRFDAELERSKISLSATQLEIDKYKALYQGIQIDAENTYKFQTADVQLFEAKNSFELGKYNAFVAKYQADIQAAQQEIQIRSENAKNYLAAWEINMRSWDQYRQAASSAFAQLGAAAYSASSVHLGASSSTSFSEAASLSWSSNYSATKNVSYEGGEDLPAADSLQPPIPDVSSFG